MLLATCHLVSGRASALHYEYQDNTIHIEPWGDNSLRVRVASTGSIHDHHGALITPGSDQKGWPYTVLDTAVELSDTQITHGAISAQIDPSTGLVSVKRGGSVVFRETSRAFLDAETTTASDVFHISINNSKANCDGGPCCIGIDGFHSKYR